MVTLVSATWYTKPSNLAPLHCHPLPPPLTISKVDTGLCYQVPSLAENKGAPPSPPASYLSLGFYQVQSRGADGTFWACTRAVRQEDGNEGWQLLVQRYNTLLCQMVQAVPLVSSHWWQNNARHSDRLVGSRRGWGVPVLHEAAPCPPRAVWETETLITRPPRPQSSDFARSLAQLLEHCPSRAQTSSAPPQA